MKIVVLLPLLATAIAALGIAADSKASLADREQAQLYVAAIKYVGPRNENGGAGPKVFVIAHKLLPYISKSERAALSIVGDAAPFLFPTQTSSDTGVLCLKVTLFEAEFDRERVNARFSFYIGVDASVAWKIRFRKTAGQWQAFSAEVLGMS